MNESSEPICVLVVDDEAPARNRLRDLLAQDEHIGRVIEAENGIAAISLIRQERPDIVLLDVQMPGLDGFGLIDALGAENMPLTVFVTACDQFAVRAFEAGAVDYLLKPFGDARYEKMMERVKARLRDIRAGRSHDTSFIGPELLKHVARRVTPGEIWDWMVVRTKEATRLVMTADIDWVGAAGVYVTLHAGGEEFLYRASLSAVASRLDPFQFVRIHRSSVVNLKSIALIESRSHGDYEIVLKDGTHLLLSRTFRAQVEARLGQSL
jgi:two-component system LytT family response regulator